MQQQQSREPAPWTRLRPGGSQAPRERLSGVHGAERQALMSGVTHGGGRHARHIREQLAADAALAEQPLHDRLRVCGPCSEREALSAHPLPLPKPDTVSRQSGWWAVRRAAVRAELQRLLNRLI